MKWYEIAILILLLPLGAYLREQTYRNVHGNATIVRDLSKLWQSLQRWRSERRERKEYNKRLKIKDNETRGSETGAKAHHGGGFSGEGSFVEATLERGEYYIYTEVWYITTEQLDKIRSKVTITSLSVDGGRIMLTAKI